MDMTMLICLAWGNRSTMLLLLLLQLLQSKYRNLLYKRYPCIWRMSSDLIGYWYSRNQSTVPYR